MSTCAVAKCNKRSKKWCEKSKEKFKNSSAALSFHKFPKSVATRKVWIERCCRSDTFNPDTAYICSDHFTKDDYEGSLKAELMSGYQFKKVLKKTAVPSIGVEFKTDEEPQDIVNFSNKCKGELSNKNDEEPIEFDIETTEEYTSKIDQFNIRKLKDELKNMHEKLHCIILEYENLKHKSTSQERQMERLQKENSALKKKLFARDSS